MKNCLYCRKELKKGKYCDNSCQNAYQTKQLLEKWLKGEMSGAVGKTLMTRPYIRNYLITKAANRCYLCGWDKLHPVTGRSTLEVDHIDGDASNSSPENLRVICPNCHSLTDTYRNLNNGKGKRCRSSSIGRAVAL